MSTGQGIPRLQAGEDVKTTRYAVDVYLNVGPDNFSGYTGTAPIALAATYVVDAASALDAAEAGFTIGNRMAADADGQRHPSDVRSVSVGDLLGVREMSSGKVTYLAVARFGWDEIAEPANRIVPIEGTTATSRLA